MTTKDGSEKAEYTFLQVGKTTTKDGKPVLRGVGSAVWSTESTSKWMMNMITPMTRAGLVPPPGKLIIDVATHKVRERDF